MASDYARALGGRLRAVRTQQGLSLKAVEHKSAGRWLAVVIGSYERGDRTVTVPKLAELAELYDVPITDLIPDGAPPAAAQPAPRLVIDLQRLQQLPADTAGPLAHYTASITIQRGDYNGQVLSLRDADLRALAIMYHTSPTVLVDQLLSWEVLVSQAPPVLEASTGR